MSGWRGAAVALLWSATVAASAGTTTFTLQAAATTSAAVFDTDGRLVRTLWSGQSHGAGPLAISWDGRDDSGAKVPVGHKYGVRLLASNVSYVWEGVIANTSAEMTGAHVHRALEPINDMAIDSRGNAFYVVGYDEQQPAIHRFSTSDPQRPSVLAHDDYRRVFRFVATDGTLAYFANVGLAAPKGSSMRDPATFVIALRVADGAQYVFPHGRAVMQGLHFESRWDSVIDYDAEDVDVGGGFHAAPSGLAVQQRGNALFIAHAQRNEIHVLDKRTGELLGRIPVEHPTGLAAAPDDTLWVLCRMDGAPAVVRFQLRGGAWQLVTRLAAVFEAPIAIGASMYDGTLIVADAGSEQLDAFSDRGAALWMYGRSGGYEKGGPDVTDDKLWLSAGPSYIAFQSDGSFWVGDPGNARNLHLSAQRRYLEQIMYMPMSYHAAVDTANPTRIFNRFLEFSVDYALPLQRSWRLVRNWATGLPRYYVGDLDGLRAVVTLDNGRSYGVLGRQDRKDADLLELSPTGLRPTGTHLEVGQQIYPDGSLRSYVQHGTAFEVYIRRPDGFDGDGNPRWKPPEPLAGIPAVSPDDPYYHDVPVVGGVNEARFPDTATGVIVFFNPATAAGYHLGGIRIGASSWLWRASPAGTWHVNSAGSIVSPDGSFETGHAVQYAGSSVMTAGQQIIYGYHGEAWNGGQADQWLHFLDDGQFVGQFGAPVYAGQNKSAAAARQAGNAFSPQLVSVNGHLYLWHNDESVHGGVHRWRIDGTDRMQILERPIDP